MYVQLSECILEQPLTRETEIRVNMYVVSLILSVALESQFPIDTNTNP
jgi:hypothetical protein